jgi:hypothetical protein
MSAYLHAVHVWHAALFILLCATVAAFSFDSTTTCHLLLPGHLGTATWLHRLLTFIIWGLTTGITLRGGVLFIGRGTFNYVLMTYTVLIYVCMYTETPIACFLFRLKNPDTKTPHTCLSQPHGGYCLHVFSSHMAVIVYDVPDQGSSESPIVDPAKAC